MPEGREKPGRRQKMAKMLTYHISGGAIKPLGLEEPRRETVGRDEIRESLAQAGPPQPLERHWLLGVNLAMRF